MGDSHRKGMGWREAAYSAYATIDERERVRERERRREREEGSRESDRGKEGERGADFVRIPLSLTGKEKIFPLLPSLLSFWNM